MIRPIRRSRFARRSAWSRETGAFTLSYVIVVPVFLIGIMTIVQSSIWYLARETVLAAARQGADVARTAQPPPGDGAAAAVQFAQSSADGWMKDVSASTDGSSATTVRITVTGQITSFVPGWTIHVSEVVTAPVEKFVALGSGQLARPEVVNVPGGARIADTS